MDKLGTTLKVSYIIYFYQKLLWANSRAVLYCTVKAKFTTVLNGESPPGLSKQHGQLLPSCYFSLAHECVGVARRRHRSGIMP